DSADGEAVGRWLLGELLVPGGEVPRAQSARKRLEELSPEAKKGMFASLARAIDDETHGRFRAAALAYIDALAAARTRPHPDAPLVAWFSSNHALRLRSSVTNLWDQGREVVKYTVEHPGNAGWRARAELVEWWGLDGFRHEAAAAASGEPRDDKGASAGK